MLVRPVVPSLVLLPSTAYPVRLVLRLAVLADANSLLQLLVLYPDVTVSSGRRTHISCITFFFKKSEPPRRLPFNLGLELGHQLAIEIGYAPCPDIRQLKSSTLYLCMFTCECGHTHTHTHKDGDRYMSHM